MIGRVLELELPLKAAGRDREVEGNWRIATEHRERGEGIGTVPNTPNKKIRGVPRVRKTWEKIQIKVTGRRKPQGLLQRGGSDRRDASLFSDLQSDNGKS